MWASASRQKYRTLNANGTMSASGPWQQISRLGNPLINEVIIPTAKKDYWNSQKPSNDSQFAKYYKAPEITAVANALYDALDTPATTNRNDLVAVLLTGLDIPDSATVPGGLQFTRTGNTQADMLRVNTGIKPNAAGACVFGVAGGGTPSRMGAIDGDLCGFPNGRRLLDDVTDIELRALVEGYGPTLNAVLGVPNRTPNNLLGDGVDANDRAVPVGLPVHRDGTAGLRARPRARRPLIAPPRDRESTARATRPGRSDSAGHPANDLVPAGNAKYFRGTHAQDYRISCPQGREAVTRKGTTCLAI